MELAAASQEGFVESYSSKTNGTNTRKKLMVVIGIITEFGHKNKRDAIRRSWLPTGTMLAPLILRFFMKETELFLTPIFKNNIIKRLC